VELTMRAIERCWSRLSAAHLVLWPLSLAFGAAAALRRVLYRSGLIGVERLPVPVIIVGNIAVGGSGKTPLVIWLVEQLRRRGYRPGVVSRGYGGTARAPLGVTPDSDPGMTGDEPLLIARRTQAPVWVGRDRPAAARALLAAHPECNVIVSDDGLQHYRMARDVEIAVVDTARGWGNGLLLPAGPLREPPARLQRVDAVVLNGTEAAPDDLPPGPAIVRMRLVPGAACNLADPSRHQPLDALRGQPLVAVAGIGSPERFFATLRAAGLEFTARPFRDHHVYCTADLATDDATAIVMTEKDAVKCTAFASGRMWVVPVDVDVDPALGDLVCNRIRR
jgi:tetraacyldisaccharide 4'-kinase